MKSAILLLLAFCVAGTVYAQEGATYCGTSCSRLTIKASKGGLGGPNSSVFLVSNNLKGTVKVAVYIKKKNGDVINLGCSDPIDLQKSYSFHYDGNDVADYCVYFINYPSEAKFPSESDVRKRMN
jgi:hypothetical protein